jgi:hypothetical protein
MFVQRYYMYVDKTVHPHPSGLTISFHKPPRIVEAIVELPVSGQLVATNMLLMMTVVVMVLLLLLLSLLLVMAIAKLKMKLIEAPKTYNYHIYYGYCCC